MIEAILLASAALAFAAISGFNDGSTLIALSLPNVALRPLASIAILVAAVALIPLVGGARVAETLARGLVSFEGQGGKALFLVAVLVALGVTFALSRRSLPTSLTLALLGAIVGTGIGRGLTSVRNKKPPQSRIRIMPSHSLASTTNTPAEAITRWSMLPLVPATRRSWSTWMTTRARGRRRSAGGRSGRAGPRRLGS